MFISYKPQQKNCAAFEWNQLKVADAGFPKTILEGTCRLEAVSSGTITDEVIQEYISIQEGEPVHDDDQFQID